MNSYNDLAQILDELNFGRFYQNKIRNATSVVNFGERKGDIKFDCIRSASEAYSYKPSGEYLVNIDQQINFSAILSENELILQCVEIFDWGGVQSSNIIEAITLHRKSELKPYLAECRAWFENDHDLSIDIEIKSWSSGWTKVFSLMFDRTAIYDSRVAAYINYIFACFYSSLEESEQKDALTEITKYLVSFRGVVARTRCLNSEYRALLGIDIKSQNNERNFKANKVASWFLRYLCKLEYGEVTQENFRKIDKAMFMLGFDIRQIDSTAPFK